MTVVRGKKFPPMYFFQSRSSCVQSRPAAQHPFNAYEDTHQPATWQCRNRSAEIVCL